jgi:hypothetical protein
MKTHNLLLCGPLLAIVLLSGIAIFPWFVPGYSQIHQTVSEIYEIGSPMQIPFQVMLGAVAILALLFAIGIYRISAEHRHGPIGAIFVGVFAITAAGLALNPFPLPLHNVFGLSELAFYQAPLVIALQWRNDPPAARLVRFSWICFIAQWISLGLNFVIFFRDSSLWHALHPTYGLLQRSLFVVSCVWSAGAGLLLWKLPLISKANPQRPANAPI